MLSTHENKERMRCKLVENLQFDAHEEASRMRDFSGCSSSVSYQDMSQQQQQQQVRYCHKSETIE